MCYKGPPLTTMVVGHTNGSRRRTNIVDMCISVEGVRISGKDVSISVAALTSPTISRPTSDQLAGSGSRKREERLGQYRVLVPVNYVHPPNVTNILSRVSSVSTGCCSFVLKSGF